MAYCCQRDGIEDNVSELKKNQYDIDISEQYFVKREKDDLDKTNVTSSMTSSDEH